MLCTAFNCQTKTQTMVNLNELRPGNLIYEIVDRPEEPSFKEIFKVAALNTLTQTLINADDCITESDYCEFIIMTEDWLVKFGFTQCESHAEQCYELGIYKAFINSLGEVNFCFFDFGDWYQHIEFVHRFQNLYSDLSNEELQIK